MGRITTAVFEHGDFESLRVVIKKHMPVNVGGARHANRQPRSQGLSSPHLNFPRCLSGGEMKDPGNEVVG